MLEISRRLSDFFVLKANGLMDRRSLQTVVITPAKNRTGLSSVNCMGCLCLYSAMDNLLMSPKPMRLTRLVANVEVKSLTNASSLSIGGVHNKQPRPFSLACPLFP